MEVTILLALQSLRFPVLTQIAALISALGNYGFVWAIIALILIFFAGRANVGVPTILAIILSGIIAGVILQPIYAHIRPCDANIGVSAVMGVSRTGFSFPSFHTVSSFAAATVIAMTAGRKWGTWAIIGAVIISLSRMYLGVEWPLDILISIIIGVLVGIVSAWVYNQFLHDLFRPQQGSAHARGKRTSISSSDSKIRRK